MTNLEKKTFDKANALIEKNKQIEEMAKDLENHTCMSQFQAEIASKMLYIKGYRKASDVAREIFEEIDKMLLDNHIGHYKTTIDTWVYEFNNEILAEIAELKKKYTEEGK